jgi:hypothetical protein
MSSPSGAVPRLRRQMWPQPVESRLGEAAVGGDLAAEHRQQRGASGRGVKFQHIVASRRVWGTGAVVVERADARKTPHDVGRYWPGEIEGEGVAQIGNLLGRRHYGCRVAREVAIGGADERIGAFKWNGEDDAAVRVLEHVGTIVVE